MDNIYIFIEEENNRMLRLITNIKTYIYPEFIWFIFRTSFQHSATHSATTDIYYCININLPNLVTSSWPAL